MQYPIFIHKDETSVYGVIVPYPPGCYSAGDTIEAALSMRMKLLSVILKVYYLIRSVDAHFENLNFKDGVLALVEIDISKISGKTTRIHVSLSERFLRQIDEYTQSHGGNRSGFLLDAAKTYMAEHKSKELNANSR